MPPESRRNPVPAGDRHPDAEDCIDGAKDEQPLVLLEEGMDWTANKAGRASASRILIPKVTSKVPTKSDW